jgi:hypothetical protein
MWPYGVLLPHYHGWKMDTRGIRYIGERERTRCPPCQWKHRQEEKEQQYHQQEKRAVPKGFTGRPSLDGKVSCLRSRLKSLRDTINAWLLRHPPGPEPPNKNGGGGGCWISINY